MDEGSLTHSELLEYTDNIEENEGVILKQKDQIIRIV